MTSPFDALRAEFEDKLDPQSMRLLCGEMSNQEMRTAKALMSWAVRMCKTHEAAVSIAEPDIGQYQKIALRSVGRARKSHPDSASSAALATVEEEINVGFLNIS